MVEAQQDILQLNEKVHKSRTYFLGAGILGAAICVVVALQDRQAFFGAYLTAFSFFLALSLGALFFVMVQHVARSAWSVTVRRIAETLAYNVVILAALSIPLLVGTHDIFNWTHADVRATDHLVQIKSAYLNLPFLYIRIALYFTIWIGLSTYFLKTSRRQDQSRDVTLTLQMGRVACGGLALYALSQSFFAFDWIMSLDAHWFSTMFGVYFFAGSVVAQYCGLIIISTILKNTGHAKKSINTEHYHDMGKLLFGHNIFWTYVAFSQFMLIWYANIPEETAFFHHRAIGSWHTISLLLPWFHFAVPFLFLMSHNVKRKTAALTVGACWLLVMCFIDVYWMVQPNFHPAGATFGVSDIGALLAVGGFCAFFFLHNLKQASLIPVGDPRLPQCLSYDNGIPE